MDIIQQTERQIEKKIKGTLPALLPNKISQTSKGSATATGTKGQLHFGSREKRAIPVMAILQAGAAIGGTLIKGINALVDAKRAKSFNNAIKMVAANVELTHQRLMTLENRTTMMAKAIMPALDDLKRRIANMNQKLTSQYRMMQMAHHRYNCILDPKTLSRYLEAITDDMEDMALDYEPVFTNIYQYYLNLLASFTNMINDLILQVPILIKLKVQVPMSLHIVETAPVPLDSETYTGVK